MPVFDEPHVDHEKHLCSIVNSGVTLNEFKKLVTNPNFICRQCGRAAVKAENLCAPVSI